MSRLKKLEQTPADSLDEDARYRQDAVVVSRSIVTHSKTGQAKSQRVKSHEMIVFQLVDELTKKISEYYLYYFLSHSGVIINLYDNNNKT